MNSQFTAEGLKARHGGMSGWIVTVGGKPPPHPPSILKYISSNTLQPQINKAVTVCLNLAVLILFQIQSTEYQNIVTVSLLTDCTMEHEVNINISPLYAPLTLRGGQGGERVAKQASKWRQELLQHNTVHSMMPTETTDRGQNLEEQKAWARIPKITRWLIFHNVCTEPADRNRSHLHLALTFQSHTLRHDVISYQLTEILCAKVQILNFQLSLCLSGEQVDVLWFTFDVFQIVNVSLTWSVQIQIKTRFLHEKWIKWIMYLWQV